MDATTISSENGGVLVEAADLKTTSTYSSFRRPCGNYQLSLVLRHTAVHAVRKKRWQGQHCPFT